MVSGSPVISEGPLVVLVGPSGAGKTTVGRLLAGLLGVPFRDTDEDVAARAGKSVAEIFFDDGEPAFRELEAEAVSVALAEHPGVLALGGGAVLDPATRQRLAGRWVVFLDVGLADAATRVGLARDRPLLAINPRAHLRTMLEERRPVYKSVAWLTVPTGGRTPEAIAGKVAAMLLSFPAAEARAAVTGAAGRSGQPEGATRITVGGEDGTPPYHVLVGTDLLAGLPGLLPGAEQVALLYPRVLARRAAEAEKVLGRAGMRCCSLEVPDGEAAKTLGVAGSCWDALGRAGFTRSDAVVGLGGGATTDLAGWVAAAWLRGVRVVQVPTTLLGMVDAAVGGKSAINVEAGKNLVGAFQPPTAVLCDLDALATLPRADYVAGLAEIVKAGFIADPVILTLIEIDPAMASTPTGTSTRELVERAIRVKAEVVTADLRETGTRAHLNYGHTLGHAIEKVERFRWRHGDAVSVGLVFAAELSRITRRLDVGTVDRHRAVLTSLGLPTTYPRAAWPQLLDAMRVDKKARGNELRFVVLDGLAKPAILAGPDPQVLAAAFEAVAE